MRKKAINRQYITVDMFEMTHYNEFVHTELTEKAKDDIKKCLDKRFESFNNDIFPRMKWLDPANWTDDPKKEIQDILYMAEHFKEPLDNLGFKLAHIKTEWRHLRITTKHFYLDSKAKEMWKLILTQRHAEFPSLCLLVEMCLVISCSNAIVERAVSHLTNIMNDKKLAMKHETMEDLH